MHLICLNGNHCWFGTRPLLAMDPLGEPARAMDSRFRKVLASMGRMEQWMNSVQAQNGELESTIVGLRAKSNELDRTVVDLRVTGRELR